MSEKTLNIIFMGTPAFSVQAAQALYDAGHKIICVYTQPPRPSGRGHKLQNSAVHDWALSKNILVRTPKSLKKEDVQKEFSDLNADVAVVAAYGLILPQAVLDAPKYGCLNIHASLLPRWRGAAPIQRAILAGDAKTGICIMQMDAGLDTGDVLLEKSTPITPATTTPLLHDTLAKLGAEMIADVIGKIAGAHPYPPHKQNPEGMTYAKMLTKDESEISWNLTAAEISRMVQALNPWPGVWFTLNGQRIKILKVETAAGAAQPGTLIDKHMTVACGQGALILAQVQPAGGKPMSGEAFLNGNDTNPGEILK